MLASGIAIFTCASVDNVQPHHHSLTGAVCISIALMCDALLGNFQQQARHVDAL